MLRRAVTGGKIALVEDLEFFVDVNEVGGPADLYGEWHQNLQI